MSARNTEYFLVEVEGFVRGVTFSFIPFGIHFHASSFGGPSMPLSLMNRFGGWQPSCLGCWNITYLELPWTWESEILGWSPDSSIYSCVILLKFFKFLVCKMGIINAVSALTPAPAPFLLLEWIKWEYELESVIWLMWGFALRTSILATDGRSELSQGSQGTCVRGQVWRLSPPMAS